ncbi:MFS transporter [Egicoccus sp. AB-alg6-2]|uniref:MFS transporter n=1 Tax=Egicoccus sp. AB-alg6-2 TaxID=3242692 RepID=UPI00359D444E
MTTPPPPSTPPGPRSTAALLRDRTFGPWFFGNAVSNSGNWLFNVTAAVVVYRLSGSALLVGLVSVAQFGPLLLFSPLGGALSDRVDRRRLLLTSQSAAAAAATALAVAAVWWGVDAMPGAWPILAAAFGIGLGQAVSAPTLNALVPALVDDADLEGAVALTSLTFNLGRALGPATAGVLLATLGAELAFVINAVTFLVLIGALLVIRPRPREEHRDRDRSVRAGLRHVRSEPGLLLLLGGVAATGFAADPMITLAPALAEAVGGGDALAAGLVSAFGVAAVPAAAMSGPLQRRIGSLEVATGGCTVVAAGLLVSAISPAAWVAVAGFGLTGVGFVLALTGFTTVLQRRVPDRLRGRVMALWSVAFLGNRPVAALIDGAAADLVGPRWAMGVAITVALLGALVGVRLQRRRA